ncbi:DEAD/DEAH box helicase [Pseudomonas sp. SZ57]|uniref:DEAD/DEAH box helicase n=1 Tax=Pseudomonas sp. SZ57 TaxID=2662259 RepID=UPI001290B882|nr:DEAD/DEAH box helicase [Pseudomonas sp. SZ57]MQQ36458.1 DEAD/DEAH box helicase [Pseudomonas sp. SZ57]
MTISLTWLKSNPLFSEVMKKTSLNIQLEDNELEFILSCAIIFLNEYSRDKRKSTYFEIAYYITLKCAINNSYYQPLLDVSSNFGFYPIAQYISKNRLTENLTSTNFTLEYQLEKFLKNEITETYEQKKYREQIIASNSKENCYIAPTSFGKSTLIVDIIKAKNPKTTAIIVPTKSLLIQTYKLIKSNFPFRHIIFHDEMYDGGGGGNFISIFTQERALRLLKNTSISFELLVIDEAHNLFEMDARSILLTRLIRRNRMRNPESTNYYLSPLISKTENLKIYENQKIFERRIANNIKEPDIYELKSNGEQHIYNRFMNEFYYIRDEQSFVSYIIKNRRYKNFLYLRAPKKVEELSMLVSQQLTYLESTALNELSQTISNNVHNDFYCVDHIKKGLIYLHGKLPDLVKEYLEHKFSNTKDLKYMVANSVILEGVNLPIDSLFIFNTYDLDGKSLTNLIGRVNRLNEVFEDRKKSLEGLLPPIHFVNSDEFNRKGGKMENKIRLLKNGVFKDKIENPLLLNFDLERITRALEVARENTDQDSIENLEQKIKNLEYLQIKEEFLIHSDGLESSKVKYTLMESGISSMYYNPESVFGLLEERLDTIFSSEQWVTSDVIDKVYLFFIKSLEKQISDAAFLRLQHPKARDFYKLFTRNLHRLNLKDHLSETVGYFHSIKVTDSGKEFFIGNSYGEISKKRADDTYGNNVYIDLSKKTDKELVNLALVKIKIESDFVSYRLNEYVKALYDLRLLTENEYNLHIYGTIKKMNAEFVKMGISGSLVNKLERDQQTGNISISDLGEIKYNSDFSEYVKRQDDLTQFEIRKYIDVL